MAVVAPSMSILGGQAVQAQRLLDAWRDDPDVRAWLVPINPAPPRGLRWAASVKYLRTIATQIAYWPLLVRELRRADVVHVFSASYFSFVLSPLPAVIVARLLGRPVILNYRSGEAPDHLERSALARAVLARVDRNLVPSGFLRDVFRSFGLAADVIPNIVDLDRFRFRARQPLAPRLVSTRNFEPYYNVACTLRAFHLVQQRVPEASLTLVGSGSLEPALRRLVVELGLKRVTFAGRVAPDEIWRCYDEADIYVQTPDIDNMPSSLLEAAASGAAVVSTDAGGVPAIVSHDVDGLLAHVGDHEAVASAVLRLIDDPALAARLTQSALQRCEHYRWEVVRSSWLSVYRDLASIRRGRRRILLGRILSMDGHEMRFRALAAVRRAGHRLAATIARPRWNRRNLRRRLTSAIPALATARRALRRCDWPAAHRLLVRYYRGRPARFVLDPGQRRGIAESVSTRFPLAADDARESADRIIKGRLDLLGYRDLMFQSEPGPEGVMPDWHLDPVHGRRAPVGWWSEVAYLDPDNGDHKIIWELNRHQHWLALGRAYWLTGDRRYKARAVAELESWMAANQPLQGINWASMLELSLRSLSWAWSLHFFLDDGDDAGAEECPWLVDLLLGLDRQMRHVEQSLSVYFSPNTHLTGEALALYVVGRVFPELRGAHRWEAMGRRVLIEEAERQIASDGGHAERSTHYHRYTLDFYLLALAVARRTGDRIAEDAFAPIVVLLARFAWAMADATGMLPAIGDDDGGMLAPLCATAPNDVRGSLSVAASLLPGLVPVDELTEESYWIAGTGVRDRQSSGQSDGPDIGRSRRGAAAWDRSMAFPQTGYYVSRSRSGDHAVIDLGPHGYLNGGHAHADALSMTLSVRWHRLLIDPGTGTYTMDSPTRDRFRSPALHNTVVIDGRTYAEPEGPFHWRTTANGRATCWAPNPRFDFVEGTHDGYAPLVHRRAVLSAAGDFWLIVDHLLDQGRTPGAGDGDGRAAPSARHAAAVHWHLDPGWDTRLERAVVEARHRDGTHVAIVSTAKRVDFFHADPRSGLGWCSPVYGQVVPCATLRFSRSAQPPFSVATVIAPMADVPGVTLEPLPVQSHDRYAYAIRLVRSEGTDLALFTVGAAAATVPGGKAQPGSCFNGFETDARFAHVRLSPAGELLAVSIVDGTRLTGPGGAFSLRASQRMHDLTVAFDVNEGIDIWCTGVPPALAVTTPLDRVRRVRLNDAVVSFERSGQQIITRPVVGHHRPAPEPSTAPVHAGDRRN